MGSVRSVRIQDTSGSASQPETEAINSVEWLTTPNDLDRVKPGDVLLNVYDVTHLAAFEMLNDAFGMLNGAGVFHVGVQVFGHEYSFGQAAPGHTNGVAVLKPQRHPYNHFRASIPLGQTKLSEEDVQELVRRLQERWPGSEYSLISRNCCHFAREFTAKLGVRDVPEDIDALPRAVNRLVGPLTTAAIASSQAFQSLIPTSAFLTCGVENKSVQRRL